MEKMDFMEGGGVMATFSAISKCIFCYWSYLGVTKFGSFYKYCIS